jgi:hypothetical protein
MNNMKYSSSDSTPNELVTCLKNSHTVIFEIVKIYTIKEELDYCIRIPITDKKGFFRIYESLNKKNVTNNDIYNELCRWIMSWLQKGIDEIIIKMDLHTNS